MQSKEIEEANLLKSLVEHAGYKLLKQYVEQQDFYPDEQLKGTAFKEDTYYKACQRAGIQKLFNFIDCKLALLALQLKS